MYFRVLINSLGAGNRTSLNQHCNIAGLKNPPEKKKENTQKYSEIYKITRSCRSEPVV